METFESPCSSRIAQLQAALNKMKKCKAKIGRLTLTTKLAVIAIKVFMPFFEFTMRELRNLTYCD